MSLSPGFWDDNTRATGIMKEIKVNEYWIHLFQEVESSVEDFVVLFEFWKAGDTSEEEVKAAYDDAVNKIDGGHLFGSGFSAAGAAGVAGVAARFTSDSRYFHAAA